MPGLEVAVAQGLRDRVLAQRADPRPDAAFAHLERQMNAADLAGLGQQALDRELEIVDLLEREVHALGYPADDEPHDGMEVAGQRRVEIDSLLVLRHLGRPMVPSPTTQSPRIRHASWPGATAVAGRSSSSSSCPRSSTTPHGV